MTIDARELSISETFKELREVVYCGVTGGDEVLIFIYAHDNEKLSLIRDFAEILLECRTGLSEANGYYVIKIIQEPVVSAFSKT
jgi:hypothetical protein